MSNFKPDRYIVIALQRDGSTEYQVSDDLPGKRGFSDDYQTISDAIQSCVEQQLSYEVVNL